MIEFKEGDIYYWAEERSPNLNGQDSGISIYSGYLEYRDKFGNYGDKATLRTEPYIIVDSIELFAGDYKPRLQHNEDKDRQYRMEFHGWRSSHKFSKNIEQAYRRAVELALDHWSPLKNE